jgi:hypothetical protein
MTDQPGNTQFVDFLLRIRADEAASKQSEQKLRQIKTLTRELELAFKSLQSAESSNLAPEYATKLKVLQQLSAEVAHQREEQRLLNEELKKSPQGQAAGVAGGRGGQQGATSLFQSTGFREAQIFRTLLYGGFSIPGDVGRVVTSLFGALSTISEVGSRFKQLTESLGGLGAAAKTIGAPIGTAVIAIAGLVLAMKAIEMVTQQGMNQLQGALEGLKTYYKEIQNITAQELALKIAQTKETLKANQDLLNNLTEQYNSLRGTSTDPSVFKPLTALLGSANPLPGVGQSLGEFEKEMRAAEKAIVAGQTALAGYTEAQKNNTTALQDAMAFERSRIEASMNAVIEMNNAIRGGDVEGTKNRIAGLKIQIDAIRGAIEELDKLPEDPKTRTQIDSLVGQLRSMQLLFDQLNIAMDAVKDTASVKANFENIAKLAEITMEIGEMARERGEVLKRQAEEQAIADERRGIEKDFAARIAAAREQERQAEILERVEKLKRDGEADDLEALNDFNNETAKMQADFMEGAAEAWARFYASELEKAKDNTDKRLRIMEEGAFKLQQLASKRQVAEFIETERALMLRLKYLDKDNDDDTRRRQSAFMRQRQEAEANLQKQLAALRQSYLTESIIRHNALAARMADELNSLVQRTLRSQDLERQLAAIREQWQIQDQQRKLALEAQDYNNRLAVMRQKQSEMLTEIQNFYNTHQSVISYGLSTLTAQLNAAKAFFDQIRAGIQANLNSFNYSPPYVPPQTTYYQPSPAIQSAVNYVFTPQQQPPYINPYINYPAPAPSAAIQSTYANVFASQGVRDNLNTSQVARGRYFQTGLERVPYDNYLANLHADEAVLDRRDAAVWRGGRGGPQVTINLTASDVASKKDVREAAQTVAGAVKGALRRIG